MQITEDIMALAKEMNLGKEVGRGIMLVMAIIGRYNLNWEKLHDDLRASNNELLERARAAEAVAAKTAHADDIDDTEQAVIAWQDLVEKTDRTSPSDYPNHALITFDELADYMRTARLAVLGRIDGPTPTTEPQQ